MIDRRFFNPDVLSCLANLSNDEVFTLPALANSILDILPTAFWSDKNAKFLDPCSKSGVFLREIAKRLIAGLENEIPDLHTRLNHIFKNQVFGIAITELTAHITRRSVYCSKQAASKYSVCTVFDDDSGNIMYERIEHTWNAGKCIFCSANQENYSRGKDMEIHAYQFIHTDKPEELFNMKFDVIVGNPPYQLSTGDANIQAAPLYHKFIQQAKKMNPRYLTMIIPSRWFAGGMGLDDFREEMLNDRHITSFTDFPNAKDCFPQNSISGGVCYFLRERDKESDCTFISISGDKKNTLVRDLNEFSVMIRYNEAVSILRKIKSITTLSNIASSLTPFGLPTNFRGSEYKISDSDLLVYTSAGISYIPRKNIEKGKDYIDKYKVLISKTGAEHAGEPGKDGKFRVFTSSLTVMKPGEICTHSYFVMGSYDDINSAENILSYLKTKFVRFLVLQSMTSINVSKSVFQFVPMQDFSEPWTDEKLYQKYGITKDEQAFIESMIRPMEMEKNDK